MPRWWTGSIAAASLGLGRHRMPTVGHDAGMFAQAGIPPPRPARTQNGSHNPHEALEQDDYAAGVRVLAHVAMEGRRGNEARPDSHRLTLFAACRRARRISPCILQAPFPTPLKINASLALISLL